MNYKALLAQRTSPKILKDIIANIVNNEYLDFETVFEFIFDNDKNLAWHTAWAIEKIAQQFPDYFSENKTERIISLILSTKHSGLHRILMSIMQYVEFPKNLPVELLNHCIDCVTLEKTDIASQALAMKLLYKFCLAEPELKNEVKIILQNADLSTRTAAFIAARKNVLRKLVVINKVCF